CARRTAQAPYYFAYW
nr:immunoglobulin heavy chain junction region [Mus musculus]